MRNPAVWKVAAVLVLAIAIVNFMLGVNLLPSFAEASERGTFAALLITWSMVMVCVVSGLFLALFLFTARPRT
jgi:ethanolamine transporter EutH